VLKLLLEHKADIHTKSHTGETPLHDAVSEGLPPPLLPFPGSLTSTFLASTSACGKIEHRHFLSFPPTFLITLVCLPLSSLERVY